MGGAASWRGPARRRSRPPPYLRIGARPVCAGGRPLRVDREQRLRHHPRAGLASVGDLSVPGSDADGYTLMGAPTIIADLDADSPWAQLDARLWDVAPGGNQTLVSRVAYRPMTTPAGRQVFQLQANGWRFAAGHVPKLELLGQDAPYVRQSNTPFTITISNLKLRLPVRERPDGVTVRKPARPLSRTGKPIGRCARALAPDLRAGCAHAAAP